MVIVGKSGSEQDGAESGFAVVWPLTFGKKETMNHGQRLVQIGSGVYFLRMMSIVSLVISIILNVRLTN